MFTLFPFQRNKLYKKNYRCKEEECSPRRIKRSNSRPNLTVTSPVYQPIIRGAIIVAGVFTSVHGPSRSFLKLTQHARQRCLPLAGEPCVKLTRELCVICHSSLLAAPSLDFAVIPMAAPNVNDPACMSPRVKLALPILAINLRRHIRQEFGLRVHHGNRIK